MDGRIRDEVPQEVPQVRAPGELGATGVLGATGFEAGREDAQEEGNFVKRLIYPRPPKMKQHTMSLHIRHIGSGVLVTI